MPTHSPYPFETGAPIHPAGTLLRIDLGAYQHVGIATGYGTVIHTSARFGKVQEHDFADFANGRTVQIVPYRAPMSGSEVVMRARQRIGQGYNPLTHNCEHFVHWAIAGQARSPQLGIFDLRRIFR